MLNRLIIMCLALAAIPWDSLESVSEPSGNE